MVNKNFRIKETSVNQFIPQVEYKENEWKTINFNKSVNLFVASSGSDIWQITYHSKETYNEALEIIDSYKEQEESSYVKYHYI